MITLVNFQVSHMHVDAEEQCTGNTSAVHQIDAVDGFIEDVELIIDTANSEFPEIMDFFSNEEVDEIRTSFSETTINKLPEGNLTRSLTIKHQDGSSDIIFFPFWDDSDDGM